MSRIETINTNSYTAPDTSQPAFKKQPVAEVLPTNTDEVILDKAVKNANIALKMLSKDERQLMVDKDLNTLVVKIINSETKEIVRQIPTEEALTLSKKMQDLLGKLF